MFSISARGLELLGPAFVNSLPRIGLEHFLTSGLQFLFLTGVTPLISGFGLTFSISVEQSVISFKHSGLTKTVLCTGLEHKISECKVANGLCSFSDNLRPNLLASGEGLKLSNPDSGLALFLLS